MNNYMPCHQYQRDKAAEFDFPILNVACKEDPAHLGLDFDATNVDIEDYDIETDTDLYSVPNFQRMSALCLTFQPRTFAHIIIGELLEHCTIKAARIVLREAYRVLTRTGKLTLTFPQDKRTPRQQRPANELVTYCDGIVSWHQTVWSDEMLEELFAVVDFKELKQHRKVLDYDICRCKGLGIVLAKI